VFIKIIILIILVTFLSPFTQANDQKILKPQDHLKQVRVGSAKVSPDGKWILYSISKYCFKREKRVGDLYLVPFNGGKSKRLTATPGSEGGYNWNPDSKKVVFSAKREGDEKNQIYIIDIRGGEAQRLTNLKSGASRPQWSPDEKWIAFTSSVGEIYTPEQKKAFNDVRYYKRLRYYHLGRGWDTGKRNRIFVVPARGGEVKQLTKGECADEGDHSFSWHPNSEEIVYVSNRSPEWWNTIDTDLFTVNIKNTKITRLTENPGPDHSPVFSPDGKWLAYRSSYEYNYESENYKIHIMPAQGGPTKALTSSLDRNVRTIAWDTGSTGLYFTASSMGNRNLQFVAIKKPEFFQKVTTGRHLISGLQVVGKNRFAFIMTTDVMPREIFTMVRGKLVQVTKAATKAYEGYKILPSEEITIDADDGTPLQGWLIKPLGYKKGERIPMLLHIHGGPHGMYSPSFRFEYQLYAHHGIAILYTNPRGSDGYGQAFADVIHEDWGTKPFSDVMRFVDHLTKMGVADPDRLAVKGGSYGGYMTNWVITHTDRFAAAVSVAGLSNMTSFFGSTDEQFFAEKEMAGVPWEKKEVYLKNSPIWYAANLKTPTMVIHGDIDWRVRTEQAEQIFAALQKMGAPSVYVNFPNQQHGVRGTKHRTLYFQLIVEWLEHWLKGKPVKLAEYIKPRAYQHPPKSAEKK
jgi:dipeptidyl aminopeptidase/acylaminoacyl peptidase